jgi:Raf kinase inhibitor-like YbhB/YbcL family protein
MGFQLSSLAFLEGHAIPAVHTGDGDDVSPPLAWKSAPKAAASLSLICEDPDAPRGTWIHWVLFNLPPDTQQLPQGVPPQPTLANGARQGKNDFGKIGYGGPAPPPGKPHRYYFRLYALDASINLPSGATRQELLTAMHGHVLAEAHLMGTYQR